MSEPVGWRRRKRGTKAQIGTPFPILPDKRSLPIDMRTVYVPEKKITIGHVVVEQIKEALLGDKSRREGEEIIELIRRIEEGNTMQSLEATVVMRRKYPEEYLMFRRLKQELLDAQRELIPRPEPE